MARHVAEKLQRTVNSAVLNVGKLKASPVTHTETKTSLLTGNDALKKRKKIHLMTTASAVPANELLLWKHPSVRYRNTNRDLLTNQERER